MLLWRGIGEFIVRHTRYATLFGAVSISNDYETASRRLMVDYLNANNLERTLARHVKPRRPFLDGTARDRDRLAALNDIEDVSRMVKTIERDGKGVPILLKQYLKLGGRLLAFSADRKFGHALDGLILVDLRASDPRILARYLGEQGAADFLSHHRIGGKGDLAADARRCAGPRNRLSGQARGASMGALKFRATKRIRSPRCPRSAATLRALDFATPFRPYI